MNAPANENARREQSVDTNANTPKFNPNKHAKAVIALLSVWVYPCGLRNAVDSTWRAAP